MNRRNKFKIAMKNLALFRDIFSDHNVSLSCIYKTTLYIQKGINIYGRDFRRPCRWIFAIQVYLFFENEKCFTTIVADKIAKPEDFLDIYIIVISSSLDNDITTVHSGDDVIKSYVDKKMLESVILKSTNQPKKVSKL